MNISEMALLGHKSMLHRVLCIPELLDMIFNFLEHEDNARNAQVCKIWSNIALDVLWKCVTEPHRLLAILAPMKKGTEKQVEYEFERPLESADWKRFEKYSKRVRQLIYQTKNRPELKQSVFDELARTRTRLDIFPNMHTLIWSAPSLNPSIIFMHTSVKTLAINLPDEMAMLSPRPYFEDISARMPNLTYFDIRTAVAVRYIETEIIQLVQRLLNLKKVTFPQFYLTTKLAEALSTLEELGTIEFQYEEQGCGESVDTASFKPSLSEGAFPTLWDLSLTASFDDTARFLNIPFAPVNLTMLYIDSNSIIENPSSIHDLLSVLAENCQLLKYLALLSRRDATETEVDANAEYDTSLCITMNTLKPALKLPNLTSLEILHQYPLSLTQTDIELFASSWPSIETLLLNAEPVYLMHSNMTLEALLPFARHCRKLTHFGMFLDASAPVTIPVYTGSSPSKSKSGTSAPPFLPFHALERLSMGVSIITNETRHGAALYLSQILPIGCELDCGITWDQTSESGAGDIDLVQARCEGWDEVGAHLPMLIQLRQEERERTRAIERELEDLRMRTSVMRQSEAMGVRLDLATWFSLKDATKEWWGVRR